MLGQDMPKLFGELCREAGTRLVLYYSGLLDGQAGLRHPEWRMKHADGSDQRYLGDFGFVTSYGNCPHSDYFDKWVAVQLRELLVNYQPDDTWVDEIPTIGPITCRLRLAERPSAVRVVPAGPPVEWTWNAGWLEMRLARLAIHACLVVR
jgi:hypothetical protein